MVGDLLSVEIFPKQPHLGFSVKCPDEHLTHDGDPVLPITVSPSSFDLSPQPGHPEPVWSMVGTPDPALHIYCTRYPDAAAVIPLSPTLVGFDTNAVVRVPEGSGATTFKPTAGCDFPLSVSSPTNCWVNLRARPGALAVCTPTIYDPNARVSGVVTTAKVARHLRYLADTVFEPVTTGVPVVFYSSSLGPWGGVSCIMQIAADLRDKGINAHVITHQEHKHDLTFRFRPYTIRNVGYLAAFLRKQFGEKGLLISTHWNSAEGCLGAARQNPGWKLASFWQDREDLFVDVRGNKSVIGDNAKTYPTISPRVVNAKWYDAPVSGTTLIPVGIDTKVFKEGTACRPMRVLAMYRPSTPRRGAPRLETLFRDLRARYGPMLQLYLFGEPATGNWFDHHYGHLTPEGVAAAMRETMIYVEPSDFQGFGLPGLEAMASGALLVSTDNKGIHEYGIDGVNCVITNDLPAGVDRVMDSEADWRRSLVEAGVTRAKEFDWSVVGTAWHKWVQETTLDLL